MKDPWLRIVDHYPNLAVGPTIPFLIGAMKRLPGASPAVTKADLRALLEGIRAEPNKAGIQWCGSKLDQFVVAPNQVRTRELVSVGDPQDPLTFRDMSDLDAQQFDRLVDIWWAEYSPQMSQGNFSFDWKTKHWLAFDNDEQQRIDYTLSKYA